MMKFKVISLDVWGHGYENCGENECDGNCDGYTVNNAFYTGRTIEVPDDADDKTFVRALVDAGELNDKALPDGAIDIDGEDDYTLYVNESSNGYPLINLERVKE